LAHDVLEHADCFMVRGVGVRNEFCPSNIAVRHVLLADA
jgi:hypothetical protein